MTQTLARASDAAAQNLVQRRTLLPSGEADLKIGAPILTPQRRPVGRPGTLSGKDSAGVDIANGDDEPAPAIALGRYAEG